MTSALSYFPIVSRWTRSCPTRFRRCCKTSSSCLAHSCLPSAQCSLLSPRSEVDLCLGSETGPTSSCCCYPSPSCSTKCKASSAGPRENSSAWSQSHDRLVCLSWQALSTDDAMMAVYSHFSETLNGLATIRAFGCTTEFEAANASIVELNSKIWFSLMAVRSLAGSCVTRTLS